MWSLKFWVQVWSVLTSCHHLVLVCCGSSVTSCPGCTLTWTGWVALVKKKLKLTCLKVLAVVGMKNGMESQGWYMSLFSIHHCRPLCMYYVLSWTCWSQGKWSRRQPSWQSSHRMYRCAKRKHLTNFLVRTRKGHLELAMVDDSWSQTE